MKKIKKGKFSFGSNENMLALPYQDKKEIYMLSTMYKADTVNVRMRNRREDNIIQKPKVIDHYNQKMGGVDKNDAIIGNYSYIPKSYKWYIEIFFIISKKLFLMDLSFIKIIIRNQSLRSWSSN